MPLFCLGGEAWKAEKEKQRRNEKVYFFVMPYHEKTNNAAN